MSHLAAELGVRLEVCLSLGCTLFDLPASARLCFVVKMLVDEESLVERQIAFQAGSI